MKTLKIGIVGAGYTASRHAEGYAKLEGVELVGVVGKRPEKAALFAERWNTRALESLETLLDLRPDAVSLCTPTEFHAEQAQRFIEAGVPVLVEKPLTETDAEANDLVNLAESRNAFVMVGHTDLFQPALLAMAGLFAKDAIGPLVELTVEKHGGEVSPKGDFRESEQENFEQLYQRLVHQSYLLDRFGGRVEHVRTTLLNAREGQERCRATLRFERGTGELILHHQPNEPLRRVVRLLGERGELVWSLKGSAERLTLEKNGRRLAVPFESGNAFETMIRHFVGLVRAGRLPWEDARSGREAMRTARRLIDAHREDGERLRSFWEALPDLSFDDWQHAVEKARDAHELPAVARSFNRYREILLKAWEEREFHDSDVRLLANFARRATRHNPLSPQGILDSVHLVPQARGDLETLGELFTPRPGQASMEEKVLRLDNVCNQRCLFCNVATEKHGKIRHDTKLARQVLERAYREGNRRLTITGGEPTLHSDLPRLVRYAKEIGYLRVLLQTNAVKLAREDFARELAESGLDDAMVSLHSNRLEISDALTQVPGTWKKTVAGIRNLVTHGVRVGLSHVITTRNYEDLPDFVDFVLSDLQGVRKIDFLLNQHMGAGKKHPELLPTFSEIEPKLGLALEKAIAAGLEITNALTFPPCRFAGHWELSLEYQRLQSLKLAGQPLDAGTRMVAREKIKAPQCARCVFNAQCFGVWQGYADIHGLDELQPIESLEENER